MAFLLYYFVLFKPKQGQGVCVNRFKGARPRPEKEGVTSPLCPCMQSGYMGVSVFFPDGVFCGLSAEELP